MAPGENLVALPLKIYPDTLTPQTYLWISVVCLSNPRICSVVRNIVLSTIIIYNFSISLHL